MRVRACVVRCDEKAKVRSWRWQERSVIKVGWLYLSREFGCRLGVMGESKATESEGRRQKAEGGAE